MACIRFYFQYLYSRYSLADNLEPRSQSLAQCKLLCFTQQFLTTLSPLMAFGDSEGEFLADLFDYHQALKMEASVR